MHCSQHHDLGFNKSSRQLKCLKGTKVQGHTLSAQQSPSIMICEANDNRHTAQVGSSGVSQQQLSHVVGISG